eukprot:Lithocolla_globosa_v1_NODE_5058_length_1312_cov_3.130469.p2 type:complete len:114 gc:universal NODE_5058_length_1312_cov_3.130469:921-1262(+)
MRHDRTLHCSECFKFCSGNFKPSFHPRVGCEFLLREPALSTDFHHNVCDFLGVNTIHPPLFIAKHVDAPCFCFKLVKILIFFLHFGFTNRNLMTCLTNFFARSPPWKESSERI